MGAKPPIFRSQDQYTQKMNRVFIIHRIWISKTRCAFRLLDPYIPKMYHVLRIRHPRDGIRWGVCNTPLHGTPNNQYVFKINHVPGQLPRPRQRPWFSFAFFSCLDTRKEGRGMGAKPPIFIPQDQYTRKTWSVFGLYDCYIRKMNRVFIIHRIWISKTWCVFGLLDRYISKT